MRQRSIALTCPLCHEDIALCSRTITVVLTDRGEYLELHCPSCGRDAVKHVDGERAGKVFLAGARGVMM